MMKFEDQVERFKKQNLDIVNKSTGEHWATFTNSSMLNYTLQALNIHAHAVELITKR